jgi:hypothetical protein
MLAGGSQASIGWADRALAMPHTGTTEVMALHIRGNGRCELGDLGGLEDLREALRSAEASGNALDMATSLSYLGEWVGLTEGPERWLELNDAVIDLCDRRGILAQAMWARAESMSPLYDAGRWDDILARAAELRRWSDEHGDKTLDAVARSYEGRVRSHRGTLDGVRTFLDVTLPRAKRDDPQVLAPALVAAALIEDRLGHVDEAIGHVRAFEEATRDGPTEYRELHASELIRVCLAHGEVALAAQVLGDRPVFVARTKHAVLTGQALLAEARDEPEDALGLFLEAATSWETYGDPFEQAHALAGVARCRSLLGRSQEAEAASATSRALLDRLGVP